jgi:carbon-monoxide dehydrogenase small subunit
MKKQLVELKVNGRFHEIAIEPSDLLIDVLREDLQLTGTKRGCDDSSCGACTVLIDGTPMLSCTMLAMSCAATDDADTDNPADAPRSRPHLPAITTVEGIAEHGSLAAIQKAYGEWGGAQCGFCTPGFMMTVHALLDRIPDPSDEDIRHALSGNLCRCTGYQQMYLAIKAAIKAEQDHAKAAGQ